MLDQLDARQTCEGAGANARARRIVRRTVFVGGTAASSSRRYESDDKQELLCRRAFVGVCRSRLSLRWDGIRDTQLYLVARQNSVFVVLVGRGYKDINCATGVNMSVVSLQTCLDARRRGVTTFERSQKSNVLFNGVEIKVCT